MGSLSGSPRWPCWSGFSARGSSADAGGGTSRDRAAIDLGDALADIATALQVPVLIAAVLALLFCALELGRFGVGALAAAGAGSRRSTWSS